MKHLYKQTFFNLHVYSVCLTILVMAVGLRAQPAPGGVSSGLQLWLRADTGTSTTTNGTALSQWNDWSGNSYHASQAIGVNQPGYRNHDTDNINFNPVLRFDGANDWLSIPHHAELNDDLTVFSVGEVDVNAGNYYRRLMQSVGSPGGWSVWLNEGVMGHVGFKGTPITVTTVRSTYGRPTIYGFDMPLGTNVTSNGYIDGSNSLAGWSSNIVTYDTNSNNPLYIGTASGSSNFWKGTMAENIIYNRVLTADERAKVNRYLALKYGVPLEADTFHFFAADGS